MQPLRPVKSNLQVDFVGIGNGLSGLGSGLTSADQVIDKTLFAATTVTAYFGTDRKQIFRSFARGQAIGKVFSWVQKDGILFWMMYPESKGAPNYYVPHVAGNFDFSKLQEQGTKTLAQQKKDEEEKKLAERDIFSKVADAGSKTVENVANTVANTTKVASYAVPALLVGGAGILLFSLYNQSQKITSKL